jgi:2-polyprenyl-3-methyl-5-hydroxy-6-metoxy-1,4-benzoquinol methylase
MKTSNSMIISSPLSNINFVDRLEYISNLCHNKKVLHLGCTDSPNTQESVKSDSFLHFHLMKISKEVVGMDISIEMIDWLQSNYNLTNIQYGNIEIYEDYPEQEFDIIVAGEILEHLSNPGKALDCLRRVATDKTQLIITVPNAYSLKGFLRAVTKHELIHRDHTSHYSLYTITNLLSRHGFQVNNSFSYISGGKGFLSSATNLLLRINPQITEGIGVLCSIK